jgi:3-deoxy-D-manno-octulosonate 8-phosphate phosphatase (KDO 8-P phosphatase)|tara:strand:- start:617 stop:1156 length:540 start_codon:yes stop_codon:yes gene_type:complete
MKIKLLILDVDGIMTDGVKYYDREGTVKLKTFCDKDWTAIKRFRAIGVNVVFLTGDPYNVSILENRNLHVIANRGSGFHSDKANYLDDILKQYDCTEKDTAYVGDDLFDIGIMKKVKYPYCCRDSPRCVRDVANILSTEGGKNAIMHLYDTLELKGLISFVPYDEVIDKIYELDLKEKF